MTKPTTPIRPLSTGRQAPAVDVAALGAFARLCGDGLDANPYSDADPVLYEAWKRGWSMLDAELGDDGEDGDE